MAGQVISKITAGDGSTNVISNSAYFLCETSASTQNKIAKFVSSDCDNFTPIAGTTIYVIFTNTNTASEPKIRFMDSTGSSYLTSTNVILYKRSGENIGITPATSWFAGEIVPFTYTGSAWIKADRTSDISGGVFVGASTATPAPNDLIWIQP